MITMLFFFFKQKTAYEMRISDGSSDVCSSDLLRILQRRYEACIATIRRRGIDIARDRIVAKDPSCGTDDSVRLKRSSVSYGGSVETTCGLMAALDRQSVVSGKRVSVRLDLGGAGFVNKKM